jgi:hypothetical protein
LLKQSGQEIEKIFLKATLPLPFSITKNWSVFPREEGRLAWNGRE